MKRKTFLKFGLVALAMLLLVVSATVIGFAEENDPEQNVPAPTLSIKTFNLSLENAVFMNFKVASTNVSNPANIKLLAWDEAPADYQKGTEDVCISTRGTEAGTGYEIFRYDDLAAKDMTKMVYVCAYVNENGVEAYSAPAKFSIAMYAYLQKNATTPDTDLCKLLDAMLSYGAAAQIYFDHNTDLLATDTLYQITVKNGTLSDGFAKGWYKENTTVTLTANAPEEGFVFSHWTNSAGEEVGTEATLSVDVTKAETYTANYVEENAYSKGLEFTSNGDGTCYVSGIGTCTDTDINIPPVSPEGWTVTEIGEEAFRSCSRITHVTIPHCITSIGTAAFFDCKNLTSILFAEGSNLTTMGIQAFSGCSNLTNINIPDNVTSIGGTAFNGCTSLISITLPDGITQIGGTTFTGCASLTNIVIPKNVTSIGGYAFSGCTKLSNVTFAENSKLTTLDDMVFQGCTSLEDITIPNGVTSIGRAVFSGCTSLESINIPQSMTSIGVQAFQACRKLQTVTFAENIKLTSIGNEAFNNCIGLKNIVIPDSVTIMGDGAFSYCSGLTSVSFSENSKLMSMSYKLFYNCTSLSSIDIPSNVTHLGQFVFAGCEKLRSVSVAEKSKLTTINIFAFDGCRNLVSITIPKSVTSIGKNAFWADTPLRTVYYEGTAEEWAKINIDYSYNVTGKSNTSLLEATKYFYSETQPTTQGNYWHYVNGVPTIWEINPYSQGLEFTSNGDGTCYVSGIGTCTDTDIKIPPVSPEGWTVTKIGASAFKNCSTISKVLIPTGVINIGASAFSGCSSLMNINIPQGITTIGSQAFFACRSLTNISIPSSARTISESLFRGCTSLESIVVQTGNAVYHSDGNCLIKTSDKVLVAGCKNSIIPTDGSVTSIGPNAFNGCTTLTKITIPNSVLTIGGNAFYQCMELTDIIIPSSVTSIASSSFNGCLHLKNITVEPGNPIYHSQGNCLIETATKTLVLGGVTSTIPTDGSVTIIGDSAFNCHYWQENITIPTTITSIGNRAFQDVVLRSITISTSVTNIGDYAFAWSDNLALVKYLGTVDEWNNITKGKNLFYITSVTEIVCTDGVVPLN